ncbi:DotA/TraY family protein (plasmid) [Lichenicola cladoniae]|uniref:DotA/TraY family protein n=1 Tax=Lichenicola cladoniae TaxID=1484109 RepID=A0A6M8HXJ2_9PROT|nr:DotA/TraY family protein [Lichenicola cladoniae]NPD66357.1 DotA/TraY family protein [Acetobacteraceae bacterium]QKE93112.1 DotA/TraY family protein [Lichenicola cladoniae]
MLVTVAMPALAQTPTGSGFNLSWSALDPGSDWAAQVIQNVFPISGTNGVSSTQTTVISQMIGQLTGFVAAIAMAYLCYATIMQIHRGAETSRLLGNNMTGMFIVRLGFAAIMMFPVPTLGFSVGQAAVVKVSLWGVGMAKAVYTNAVQAIGPDALVVAQPMVPGTETIVQGLIQNELCRSLVNAASNTTFAPTQLVPEPTPVQIGGATGPMTILGYTLSVGNIGSAPACGTVTIAAPLTGSVNLAGVAVDQSAIQQQALTTVLNNDIKTQVEQIAGSFFKTRKASELNGLMGILTSATRDYTTQLTTASENITKQLRASLQTGGAAALANSSANQTQLTACGWTCAGAYYLEFARLNGQTLSLLSGVPQITPPSYDGFGPSLSSDLAPLIQSSQAFMTTLSNYVTTQDGLSAPGGQGDLFSGATPGQDGSGVIEQVFRRLHLNDYMLQLIQTAIAPNGNNWTDPFSSLMSLGNTMITIAVAAMGLAALAASGTASTATTAFQLLTFNFAGAGMTVAAHFLMSFLGTPIFALLLALLIPGLTIAFVLPMIPWVMWMAGVMGWLILVCEAVIAVPLWMLAHMTMQGEGLHGKANEGYGLLFNVLFRPTLMLFGLFLGYFIFSSMSFLIRQTFGIAAGFVLEHGWIVTNVLGVVVLLSIFVMTHVVAAMMSFRMISLIPHHVPRLLGFTGAGRVDMDQFSRDAAVVGVGGTLATINSGLRAGMKASGQAQVENGAGTQPQISGPANSSIANTATGKASSNRASSGMDTTLRAATDLGPSSETEG